jgi:O-antigen/teichoic acid export membrane protein
VSYLRWRYRGIYFEPSRIDLSGFRQLYSYSIYSFVIAIALKILFYTDSLVIGRLIGLQHVTYYAIPSTLLDYIEKFVWAMIAVLIPVISGNSAKEQETGNQRLYLLGTRYSLLLSAPVIISLFWLGPDFITLWMGVEIGSQSMWVLRILLAGYGLAFSQLVAHGLLKGIARHRVLALVMIVEAGVNLVLSVVLAPRYGIEGVAIGTALPLWMASFALMVYTCRCLKMSLLEYLFKGYGGALFSILLIGAIAPYLVQPCEAYWQVFGQSFIVLLAFLAVSVPLCVDGEHLAMVRKRIPFFAAR